MSFKYPLILELSNGDTVEMSELPGPLPKGVKVLPLEGLSGSLGLHGGVDGLDRAGDKMMDEAASGSGIAVGAAIGGTAAAVGGTAAAVGGTAAAVGGTAAAAVGTAAAAGGTAVGRKRPRAKGPLIELTEEEVRVMDQVKQKQAMMAHQKKLEQDRIYSAKRRQVKLEKDKQMVDEVDYLRDQLKRASILAKAVTEYYESHGLVGLKTDKVRVAVTEWVKRSDSADPRSP